MIVDESADQYYAPDGVQVLVAKLGDLEMVELGDRLGEFFDRSGVQARTSGTTSTASRFCASESTRRGRRCPRGPG